MEQKCHVVVAETDIQRVFGAPTDISLELCHQMFEIKAVCLKTHKYCSYILDK